MTELFLHEDTRMDPFEAECRRMDDHGLVSELERIRKYRAELDRQERIVQSIRSARYRMDNWFIEEMNSIELCL